MSESTLPDSVQELVDACNLKHVKVVQAILSGEYSSNTKAYQSVYTDTDAESAKTSVARMLTIDNVQALYEALRDTNIVEGILSRDEAMKILSDMARTGMSDLAVFGTIDAGIDDDGNPVKQAVWSFKDSALLDEAAMRSISELNATRDGLKIKQHDQKAAIKQLAEMAGWEAPKKLHHSGRLEHIPPGGSLEDAAQTYEDNLRRQRDGD